MRKSFAQVLREGNVDIRQEYSKLFSRLHQKAFDHRTKSLYEVFGILHISIFVVHALA